MKRSRLLVLLTLCTLLATAQDSTRTLSLREVYRLVLDHHPVAKQAALLPDAARAELRMARGMFDPVLKSGFDEKNFEGKEYWKSWENSLVVPVWFGTDIKAGFDNSRGPYLDSERVTPGQGLSFLGVSVPLGQGLLIDERRATVRQAQLLGTLAAAEQVKVINKLLLQVNKDYLDWTYAFTRLQWHEESLRLAEVRFDAIRMRVLFGDQPAIDSLEALIEVQNRENIRNQSLLDFTNARLIMSNHLWSPEGAPLEMTAEVVPTFEGTVIDTLDAVSLNAMLDSANSNHPELVKLRTKLQGLEIEKRWAAEKLRPKLNLDYNFLAPRADGLLENGLQPIYQENYKMGLSFRMPLFLREERGKLNLMKIKMNQTEQEQLQTNREITNQVRAAYNELNNLGLQLRIQQQQLENAEKLLAGELYKFENGESFLFLVNSRENAVINSRIKLAELKAKYGKSRAFLSWSAGRLIAE